MLAQLFFPPVSDPTFPPHGIARLAGFLAAHGRAVSTHDLNVEFVHHALGPRLAELERELAASVAALDARDVLEGEDWDRYQAQAKALLVARPVIENVGAAVTVLQTRAHFDDPGTYNWACHVLDRAMRLVSARYFPTNFGFHNWSSGNPLDLAEIHRCLAIEDEPFGAFYDEVLPALVPADEPVLFGLSVQFLDQLVPALALARALKSRRPDAQVVLGGALITHLAEQAARLLQVFPFLDVLVPGAGEQPLLALLDGKVPTGVFLRGRAAPKQHEVHRYDVADSPPPLYPADTLPRYLSPEPVLPIRGSRGCYWGRCVYCSHHMGEGRYAPRKPEDAFRELQHLRDVHGARTFYLSDDALSPAFLRRFSDLLLAAEPDGVTARWFGDARPEDLDDELLAHCARAGLVMLFLGVESANERVRGLMQRGSMARVRATIEACHRHGIALKLNFILGFPGETEAELEETLAFIASVRAPSDVISSTPFYLTRGSPLQLDRLPLPSTPDIGPQTKQRDLAHVDVQIATPSPDDFTLLYDFTTSAGRTAQQTIDDWQQRLTDDPRLRVSGWRYVDLSRTHRALLHDQHVPDDFVPAAASAASAAPSGPPTASVPFAGEALPSATIVRVRAPVVPRVFRHNLAARGGPTRIPATAFVTDDLLRFPNPSGDNTLCGVPPAVGALVDGDLRAGLSWAEIERRLADVPHGTYAVSVLVRVGLLEVVPP